MSIAEASARPAKSIRSLVPARLDRLPWSRFHWLVITGLGVSWILDGLEIQIVALVGTVLQDRATLHLSAGDVGLLGSIYLLGEVVGALVFGRITDHIGRKKMFMACLGLYLCFSGLGAFSFNLWSLLFCRFVAGMGIGGEYTAINSAIDELIPSHYRGQGRYRRQWHILGRCDGGRRRVHPAAQPAAASRQSRLAPRHSSSDRSRAW